MDGSYVNVAEDTMESGQFSTAVFHNVAETYLLSSELPCEFTIAGPTEKFVDEGCWIGLFKVGWENLNECIFKRVLAFTDFQGSPQENGKINVNLVLGDCKLSTEEDEFYQFCLVSFLGEVLGASCPFQLRDQQDDSAETVEWWFDLGAHGQVEEEIVDDAILVHNKTTLLEESVARLTAENATLKAKEGIKEEKLKDMEEVKASFEIRAAGLAKDLQAKDQLLKESADELPQMKRELDLEKNLRCQADAMLEVKIRESNDLKLGVSTSERLVAELADKLKGEEELRQQLCLAHDATVSSLRETINELRSTVDVNSYSESMLKKQFDCEMSSFATMYEKLQTETLAKQELLDSLIQDKEKLTYLLTVANSDIDKLRGEVGAERAVLERRLRDATELNEELSMISDQRHIELQETIDALELALGECNVNRDNHDSLCKEQCAMIQGLEAEIAALNAKLEVATGEVSELQQQNQGKEKQLKSLQTQSKYSTGSNHALRVACSHMQKQIAQLKQKNTDSQSDTSSAVPSEPESQPGKEVEELKLRLCMGASAYRSKVLECKRLKEKIKEMTQSNSTSPQSEEAMMPTGSNKADAEIQTSKVAQEDSDAADTKCKQLETEIAKNKSEHENVVNVLLFEIQKLAEKIEANKRSTCSGCGPSNTAANTGQKADGGAKLRLKDLAEQAPAITLEPSFSPSVPSRLPHNNHPLANLQRPTTMQATAPTGKTMHHSVSVDSADITCRYPIQRTIRRCGSEPVIYCPVCDMHFPQTFTDKAATEHVNAHFT